MEDRVRASARRRSPETRAEAGYDPMQDAPPGWVYNPSSWRQRTPIAILAFVGFGIATTLALFQMGAIHTIWEPFFGAGTKHIITGRVSHLLPIPDAALGALGYLADAVSGLAGGPARWRRMPWIVVVFAICVIPFGITSLTLFILQPTLYDTWCTLCLLSVAISLAMAPYAWDEFRASWSWIRGRVDAGASWRDALLGR